VAETICVPCAACCTLREISCVAAPCSSTAAAIAEEISASFPMVPEISWLAEGFSDKPNPENRLLGFVQQFHLPFGILFQVARKTAEKVSANLGHLAPSGLAAFKFRSLIGCAGIAALADPKKIQRH
jgi:hypothetical protein